MADENENVDDPGTDATGTAKRPGGMMAMVLPFATALAALALGAVLGVVIGWSLKPGETVETKVPRDLTAAELAAACAPQLETKVGELEEAQNKVAFLE